MDNPIRNLKLDVNAKEHHERITVKQGDSDSRTYKITLINNSQTVTISPSDVVQAKAERHRETVALVTCPKSGNDIILTLSKEMLAVAGNLRVEIVIYTGNKKLTSATLIFEVDRSISEGLIVNTPDFSALDDMVKRVEEVLASPNVDGELKDARGGEKALRYRLDNIENGNRIAQGVITNEHLSYDSVDTLEIVNGAVTLDKISDEALSEFANSHNHDDRYIRNASEVITPDMLSAAAKSLFALAKHKHSEYATKNAAGILDTTIVVSSESLKSSVNTAAIQNGSVTEPKIADTVLQKYGRLPFADVTDYGNSADIPYDHYTDNGIYRFTGRYTPIILFVFIGSVSYTTQIRIQGEQIQTRVFNVKEWTEWSGGKAEIAESFTQLDAQIAQLQIDTQEHDAKLDVLDRSYAGTATIATTNNYKMNAAQVIPESEVLLTLINGPTTSCFVRSDHYPLYYYGTNQVVQPEYNTPIPVSAEDLIAGIKLNYGGAFTIKYQTAPSKVFFEYADNAAKNTYRELAEKYQPYWNNQVAGKAAGTAALLAAAMPGTELESLIISGKTSVGAEAYPDAPSKVYLCGTNLLKLKQDTRTAGGLTMSCDGDIISISGSCTGTNLYVFDKITRFDVPFTLHVQVITGSSTGAGMYFAADTLVAFKTQAKHFPNGITAWSVPQRWIVNSASFTDDFTCRVWATPGNTPDMPYEPYSEQEVLLPEGLALYGTPGGFKDTYDVVSGLLTSRCTKLPLAGGWIFSYSTEADTVTWITNPYYAASKQYYLVHGGTVTTHTTDWQGKISMSVNKADAGITAEDTAATATQKIKTYFANSYAILPLKQSSAEQLAPASVQLPSGSVTVLADQGDTEAVFCRDINTAFLDLLEYTTGLEARIAQLEISTGGGGTV